MNDETIDTVPEWSCEERYDYFLGVVGEEREVWILVNEDECFLRLCAEDEGLDYLPLWPTADFAADYAQGDAQLTPRSIALPTFLNKWIAGLTRDGLDVGIFPGLDRSVWISEPEELARDLKDEISQL